ncbi:MAG: extracellular solute-binding protein [Saccharofermentanales bacterium]
MIRIDLKKSLLLFVLLAYVVSFVIVLPSPSSAAESSVTVSDVAGSNEEDRKDALQYNSLPIYPDYLAANQSSLDQTHEVEVDIDDYSKETASEVSMGSYTDKTVGNRPGLYTPDNGEVSWEVFVPDEGFYNIGIEYFTVSGKGSSIVRSIEINGEVPFREAQSITFQRSFANESDIVSDFSGNDIRPVQMEIPSWQESYLADSLGYYTHPFLFYFKEGVNVLKFISVREPLVIGKITLCREKELFTYPEIKKEFESNGYAATSKKTIIVEGEDASLKSARMLYPISDSSSPLTSPSSYNKKLLNTIGGQRWQAPGQWIEWVFEAPGAGLYKLAFKARQNTISGKPSYRKIYINGEVPYNTLEQVKFPYSNQWELYFPGHESLKSNTENKSAGEYVYLKKGKNVIRMEAVTAELAPLVQEVSESLEKLNGIYLELLMYIGPTPDIYRDYQFEARMPKTLVKIQEQAVTLSRIADAYEKIQGESGPYSQQLRNFSVMLKKMNSNTDKIAPYFNDFINNISSLGTWVNTVLSQPLEIDYIVFLSPDSELPRVAPGVFSQLGYLFQQFISSFFIDYNAIGSTENTPDDITVWMSAGRDQANSLNQLIVNGLTPKEGIRVKLELVPAGTLLPATLAGKGPDAALNCAQSDPLNYAIRGAVQNLSVFEDSDDVVKRFAGSAIDPLKFEGELYGLPETQSFPVLFYRKDILDMLDIDVPETWDDVIGILPILQKNNMNFGLPQPYISNITGAGFSTFAMFLYQQNGNLYSENGDRSLIDNDEAINAFFTWTNFYNEHSLPVSYDFVSRFRTGEIPIGIADYSMFNVLSVFAPELNGVWSFGLVPGTMDKNGVINHSVASTVTASIIMNGSHNTEATWKFLKWWVTADVQNSYGNEIESIMGTAGRYQTANIEAFYNIPWSSADFTVLSRQWGYTKGIREVPGSYMTPRYVDFAFKQAFTGTTDMTLSALIDPGEIIQKASKLINEEIKYKRHEFGLD